MSRRALASAAFLAVLLAIAPAFAQAAPGEVTYTVRGMAYEGPDRIPAGLTTITIDHPEDREDLVALISLAPGRTIDEFFATMEQLFAEEISLVPEWIAFHGGAPLGPGDRRSYTVFLSPGTHYLLSIAGDDEGPFAARGLLLPIEVEAAWPEPEVTVTLADYEFTVDGTFRAGDQLVRVVNSAAQPHEMLILPLPPGVRAADLFAPPAEGEHAHEEPEEVPSAAIRGVWAINPGETVQVPVDLEPGTYALVCFVPDADGPHAMQGMVLEVTVE